MQLNAFMKYVTVCKLPLNPVTPLLSPVTLKFLVLLQR